MSLRVLLADESTTIKKVFKWALQDYGAEVFTVAMDETLISSILTLKPDIIFLDTFLKKKSGYELSAEIKMQKDLASIPTVILWNHFVPLDKVKFKNSKANESLEKPFSVMVLREKVQRLVPKLKTQILSQYLTFPENDELKSSTVSKDQPLTSGSNLESSEKVEALDPLKSEDQTPKQESVGGSLELEGKAGVSSSGEISLKDTSSEEKESSLSLEEEDDWVQKNVFKVENPSAVLEEEESEKKLFLDQVVSDLKPSRDKEEEIELEGESNFERLKSSNEREGEPGEEREEVKRERGLDLENLNQSALSVEEEEFRNQSKKIIESIAWKVVPDLASQIIEREIQRLLSSKEEDL